MSTSTSGLFCSKGVGHINGAFLEADLVDKPSLLIVPGIDGRDDIPAAFGGVNPKILNALPLKLKSVHQRENDVLWIRYDVVRPSGKESGKYEDA